VFLIPFYPGVFRSVAVDSLLAVDGNSGEFYGD
jgi:hypothetical protein